VKTRAVNLRLEPYDVYIGRPGRGHAGLLGNPVKVGEACLVCSQTHWSKGDTIPCFKRYFDGRIATDPKYKALVLGCKGQRLGCFCRPERGFGGHLMCHGQVIAAYLEGVAPEKIE